MQLKDFSFDLPESLIADHPAEARTGSRLLSLDVATGKLAHGRFSDLLDYLNAGDLLVFNDTRVIPARMFGHKHSGGRIEILLERVLNETTVLAQLKSNKPLKPGGLIYLTRDEAGSGSESNR